jgi:hypothetical protein
MTSASGVPVLDSAWAAESNLARILATTGAIHLLALISVGLRLYARIGILRSPGRDDVVIVLSAVSTHSQYLHDYLLTQLAWSVVRLGLLRPPRLLWSWSTH